HSGASHAVRWSRAMLARADDTVKRRHWANLLRQLHSALASRPSRSARTATLRAGRQPSTYVQLSPRLVAAPLSSNGHVRLGLPARARVAVRAEGVARSEGGVDLARNLPQR